MRAALYIRVSTPEQARDEKLSLPAQEQRCRAAAEAAGARIVATYTDAGLTSQNLDRPGLQALLADLERIDVIYMIDMGRLTLSPRDLDVVRERLIESGTSLVTLDGVPDITTDTGEFVGTVMVAARRVVKAGERARAIQSLSDLAARGHHHGRCPLGYRRPRDAGGHIIRDAPLEVVPDEAEIVRRVMEQFARGMSIAEICRRLNGDGVPGKRGPTSWWTGTITRILDNPTYVGLVRYHDQLYAGEHEPLVSEHLWAAVQARRAREQHLPPRMRVSLSPLLECGICGGGVHRTMGGKRSAIYRCAQHGRRPVADRHEPVTKSAKAVELVIWTWTRELLRPEALEAALSSAPFGRCRCAPDAHVGGCPAGALPSPSALQSELASLEEAIAYNLSAARAGGLPPDLLARENAPLLSRREEILRELRGPAAAEWTPAQLRWLDQATPELVDRLAALEDQGRQRQFLERLYARLVLHRGGLVFYHRLPGLPARGVAWPRALGADRGWSAVDLTPWQP